MSTLGAYVRFAAAVCLGASPALAQYTVRSIAIKGTTPFSQADLAAATGLKIGSSISTDDLSTAAARLVATGEFDDVQATVAGTASATQVAGFLKNNTALLSLNGYAASFTAKADPDTHTVELTVKFFRGAGAGL